MIRIDNCTYNKIKVLRELSLVSAFIGKHCKKDARACKHKECGRVMDDLQKNLQKYIGTLKRVL